MTQASTIGIREFKADASAILRRAQAGEKITVTDRGRPIVQLGPVAAIEPDAEERIAGAIRAGRITWSGGKPRGLERSARFVASVSSAVIEDRR